MPPKNVATKYLNGKEINKNTVFGILHGSKNTTLVYIVNAEYSDTCKST